MKNTTLFAAIAVIISLASCQKEFLQMPISNSTTVDTVFSTSINAQAAIASAYQQSLSQGLPYQGYWNSMLQDNLSGAMNYGFAWTIANPMVLNGMSSNSGNEDMDGFNYNYTAIRQDYLVKENIGKVKDMSDADKAVVRAEMQALIAYRYEQMMIMYGGVPIVSRSFAATDNLVVSRHPLKQVLDSIVTWCDYASAVVPSQWPSTWRGRMTKSAVMAIKAKALLYAARPLFNTATPYLNFGGNNNLVCLGGNDPSRWDAAAKASEAEIAEAEGQGGLAIINTGNPLDDYGKATSLPGNMEVVLAYKSDNSSSMYTFYNAHTWQAYGNLLNTNQLKFYYKSDGTDEVWPNTTTVKPFSEYLDNMNAIEARFKACFQPWQMDAWNNPGDNNWSNQSMFQWQNPGCARITKFYYKAGTRSWFEFPVFRLASAYLSSAEAYNELGQTQLSLDRLNKIHLRAGLPAITEKDKNLLRAIIQREWMIEFFDENYRLHDIKHWKLAGINNGLIGGSITAFTYNGNTGAKLNGNTDYQDKLLYQAFWADREYLNPFPQTEVNKSIIVQNPGY
ncbi:Starch-binding associating with outer membrane [Mucilaginibacter sp. OK268]|nr:Starch-binding associating with outer membrane [Mucilaginibacter sp. OK268]